MSDRRIRRYSCIMCLLVVLFALGAMRSAFLCELLEDEGHYLYISRLVYQGQLPYRDFGLDKGPLLPYIYGLPQILSGGSILVGRLTSFVLGLATLLLASTLARRLAGDLAALITAAMLCATSTFIFVFTTTRTEPVTAFFVVLSLYFLLGDARPRRGAAGFLAVSAMIWAATVRVSSLPAAFLVLGIVLYQNRDSRVKCAMIVLGAVLQFAIILGIPFAAARENMIFHVFTAQLERYTHFQPGARFSLRRHVAEVSAAIVDHLTRLYVGVASATLALGTFGLFTFKSQLIRRIKPHYLIIAGLALALYIPQLTVRWIGEVYLMPSITILAILVGCGMSDLYYKLRSSAGATLVLAVAVSMILTQAANCVHDERWHMTLDYWPIAHLDEVARYVQQVVGPDEQIATLSTYIALEAHRRVPPGFEMSWFSLFPGLSNERAAQLKVINRALFDEALRDPKTRCVAVTHYEFGLLAGTQGKRPPPRIMTEEEVLGLLDGLPSDYKLAKVVTHFGQIYDTLYILTR